MTRGSRAAVVVPVAVMLVVGLWGLDRGGMWRDEAVTFQVARRSVPQIWRLLHGVDAVHGLYYLLMHAVLAVRPDEVALRLPSVCAAAVTAGLVGALGVRLSGRARVGLWAGLLYAVTPMAGHYAQEGRSYALVAAGVVGTMLLLVRGAWWAYGVVLAVTCVLHEMAVLVVCAHAVTLVVIRGAWGRWVRAVGGAGVVLVPLVVVSWGQAGQVGWLSEPGWRDVEGVVRGFAVAPKGVVFWGCVGLAVVGVGVRRLAAVAVPLLVMPPGVLMVVSQVWPMYDDRYVLYALAGMPLLVAAGADRVAGVVVRLRPGGRRVPTRSAVRNACPHDDGQTTSNRPPCAPHDDGRLVRHGLPRMPHDDGRPVRHRSPRVPYDDGRSVKHCPLPAPHDDGWSSGSRPPCAPRSGGRSGRGRSLSAPLPSHRLLTLAGALVLVLLYLHHLPLHRQDRQADHRPDDLSAPSAALARELRPGDPVLFLPAIGRRSALAYPEGYGSARDIALRQSGAASGTLYGTEIEPRALWHRLAGVDRVWVVVEPFAARADWEPAEPTEQAKLAALGGEFARRKQYARGGVALRLYVRTAPPAPQSPAPQGPAPQGPVPSRSVPPRPAP